MYTQFLCNVDKAQVLLAYILRKKCEIMHANFTQYLRKKYVSVTFFCAQFLRNIGKAQDLLAYVLRKTFYAIFVQEICEGKNLCTRNFYAMLVMRKFKLR